VYVGVTIGIISLRLVAGYAMKMIERYPVLEHAAFILIGYVGVLLMLETYLHVHFDKLIKFAGIIGIIGASMAYERSPTLQRGVRPLLRMCLLPMELISAVVGSVFVLIAWPFRRVAGLLATKRISRNAQRLYRHRDRVPHVPASIHIRPEASPSGAQPLGGRFHLVSIRLRR